MVITFTAQSYNVPRILLLCDKTNVYVVQKRHFATSVKNI